MDRLRASARRMVPTFELLEERMVLSTSPLPSSLDYATWRQQEYTIGTIQATGADWEVTTGQEMATGLSGPWASDAQANGLIGLPSVQQNYPFRGNGYSVAVIDTGIDYRHSALGGGWGTRVIAGYDFVNNDGDPMDDNGHGTHVAGIIGSSNATYAGVAPGVNLIALKVLGANGSGTFGDVEDALRWVMQYRQQYNIVAVNLSLGAGNYSSNPYGFLEDEFSALRGAGVFLAAASGNSFYSVGSQQGLGYPAISGNTVSVGAVWDASVGSVSWSSGAADYSTAPDRITSFTQRNSLLDILAPGAFITNTYLGGGYATLAGTSMATPVVAGAAALIRQALDAFGLSAQANQDGILAVMRNTGRWVNDGDDENDNVTNTGYSFPRLDLFGALNSLANQSNRPPVLGPLPDLAMSTRQDSITITLNGTDPEGATVRYTATTQDSAARLAAQYGFNASAAMVSNNYYLNTWGLNEKYFYDSAGRWNFILPDGTVWRWGGTIYSCTNIGAVDRSYYQDPALLFAAARSSANPATVSISGNQLTINPANGYTGILLVTVSASDGALSTARTFNLTVRNLAPTLPTIADRTMNSSQDLTTIALGASDPDGDPLSFTASATDAAYLLDAARGFSASADLIAANYYVNTWGLNEKYFVDSANRWHFILPDGTVWQWGGSIVSCTKIESLDRVYYQDPTRLWRAESYPSQPATATVNGGGTLTINPPAGYAGTLVVTVSASDGVSTARQSFRLNVSTNPPAAGGAGAAAIRATTERAGQAESVTDAGPASSRATNQSNGNLVGVLVSVSSAGASAENTVTGGVSATSEAAFEQSDDGVVDLTSEQIVPEPARGGDRLARTGSSSACTADRVDRFFEECDAVDPLALLV